MKKYVVDASIVLTALLSEDTKVASRFKLLLKNAKKKKIEIWSTSQLPVEVANGLRFSLTDVLQAREAFERFSLLPIQLFSITQIHTAEILKLSYQLQTTVYDTAYHYVAQLLEAIFLTCDEQYYKRAKELGGILLFTQRGKSRTDLFIA